MTLDSREPDDQERSADGSRILVPEVRTVEELVGVLRGQIGGTQALHISFSHSANAPSRDEIKKQLAAEGINVSVASIALEGLKGKFGDYDYDTFGIQVTVEK